MFLVAINVGCVPMVSTEVTSSQGPDMASARAEAYDGPKARIAVSRFDDKTRNYGGFNAGFGTGMADMLTTSLFNTSRFIVLERQQIQDVITEQDFGASGRVRQDTAARIGEIEGADLLITGAVTEWDPGSEGGDAGISRLPIPGRDIVGALAGTYTASHVGMDIRIIDANTGRIVAATSVAAEARGFGGHGGAGSIHHGLAGSLGGYKNTPMETAIRAAIQEAVTFITTKTPQTFYRY
jgi:curli biogenesis system outer membrane secretion channel CsgG